MSMLRTYQEYPIVTRMFLVDNSKRGAGFGQRCATSRVLHNHAEGDADLKSSRPGVRTCPPALWLARFARSRTLAAFTANERASRDSVLSPSRRSTSTRALSIEHFLSLELNFNTSLLASHFSTKR
ncbi:unnamed protein product [Arctia plantaginis]|uniref:Uncharacterized protein n=1 Tax=Arctia plantaginis TaxID=874455 RepID=A0A8S0YZU7_ARCPL|nr:unnamed protein product [Arctia plantaginis]